MKGYVGVTDYDWLTFLASCPRLDEVNFWKPGGEQGFSVLSPGDPFFFKLHAPYNAIAGGGFFATFSKLPTSIAWEAFGERNGARSLPEMRSRVERYRRVPPAVDDYTIGCIVLASPYFLAKADWIPVPPDWRPSIVQGKSYNLAQWPGSELWSAVRERLATRPERATVARISEGTPPRYGDPLEILPRLGQGTFRVLVTDAYGRRCAMTGERTLPVLDAAHIKPFAAEGANHVQNGLLLRSDLHRLYDRGYLTVTPSHRIEVSRRIKEEFENGRDYYALADKEIRLPAARAQQPDSQLLEWHADSVFRR